MNVMYCHLPCSYPWLHRCECLYEETTEGLDRIGIPDTEPQGADFVLADISPYLKKAQRMVASAGPFGFILMERTVGVHEK